jgi:hypothetical protein
MKATVLDLFDELRGKSMCSESKRSNSLRIITVAFSATLQRGQVSRKPKSESLGEYFATVSPRHTHRSELLGVDVARFMPSRDCQSLTR